MPYKDPDVRAEYKKEYNKQYYKQNKEIIKEQVKEYYKTNKESINARVKEYAVTNKEKIKEYRQTPNVIKNHRISRWKCRGVKHEDYSKLHDYYLSIDNCEECNIELTYDKVRTSTTKCLDHDHDTGLFRNVLCHSCNIKRQ